MTPTAADLPKLANSADIAEAFGCAQSQVMRMVQDGKIPAPVIDGYRFKRWHPEDVRLWLDRRRQRVAL